MGVNFLGSSHKKSERKKQIEKAHRAAREETKMNTNTRELNLEEMEQVNGGDFIIGAAILCGLIYYGTVMACAYLKK